MNFFQKAKKYDEVVEYNSKLIQQNTELRENIFSLRESIYSTVYKSDSSSYKDAIQDMQSLIVKYQENQPMLAVIAPIIEYLKDSYLERRKVHASVRKKRVQSKHQSKVEKKLLAKRKK